MESIKNNLKTNVTHINKNKMQKEVNILIYPKNKLTVYINQDCSTQNGTQIIIKNIDSEILKMISEDLELSQFLQVNEFYHEICLTQSQDLVLTIQDNIITIFYDTDEKAFTVKIFN